MARLLNHEYVYVDGKLQARPGLLLHLGVGEAIASVNIWRSACGMQAHVWTDGPGFFSDGRPYGNLVIDKAAVTCRACKQTEAYDPAAYARAMRAHHARIEAQKRRTAILAEAKNRALERLARAHPDEYRDFYEAEFALLGLDASRPRVRVVPRPDQLGD